MNSPGDMYIMLSCMNIAKSNRYDLPYST